MSELALYGVAADFYIPIPKAASTDFAVAADWTPAAGDVKVIIDGTDNGNITTLPTAVTGRAVWKIPLSAAELTGKKITVVIVDSATKVIVDQALVITTINHASAAFASLWASPIAGSIVAATFGTGAIAATTFAAGAIDAAALAADAGTELANAKFDQANGIETGLTERQALRLIAAVLLGEVTGAGTATEVFRNAVADTKTRVTTTADASGNRSAVVTDAT